MINNKYQKIFLNDKIIEFIEKMKDKKNEEYEKILIEKIKNKELEDCKNYLLSKKDDEMFEYGNNNNILFIDKGEISNKSPNNINILNKECYSKMIEILNKERIQLPKSDYFISLVYNNGKIYLKLKNNEYFDSKNKFLFFIYEYTLLYNDKLFLSYIPEQILFFSKEDERNKYFENLINDKIDKNKNVKSIKINKNKEDKKDNNPEFNLKDKQKYEEKFDEFFKMFLFYIMDIQS